MAPDPTSLLIFLLLLHSASAAVSPTSSPPSAPTPSSTPIPKPPAHSSPISSSTLDPKQLSALQSLNIPTSKDPCSPPPHSAATTTCDSSAPFRHLLSLTLSNCSEDVALSLTALKSLSTLTSLNFINCPVTPIRLPAELTSNLHSFTCINSLKKLTGVWLSRLQNVTELTVSRVSITASGPTIILGGMKFLHSVTLSQANLSGNLPKHWHPNLTFVDLSANHLKGKIPISLTRLENLVHLNLSSNSLNETIPTTIGDLSALQNLSLASNSLSGPIPESLAAMPWLTHLDLSFNQLNGTIPNFIRDMKKLKYLNLASNSFHGVLPFNATFIKGLEVFKVGENSNLCYNHTVLGSKVKLGIAACDKHGLPLSPAPAKDSSADDSSDGSDDDDYGNVEEKKHHNGPSKLLNYPLANPISPPAFLSQNRPKPNCRSKLSCFTRASGYTVVSLIVAYVSCIFIFQNSIFHNKIWEDFFSLRIPFFIFHPSLLSTHPDLRNHFFLLKLVHLAEVPDRSVVLSIRGNGDKGRHKKKSYKADDNARSFDGNSSLSPNKEEILALFKRIQSSISKGGEAVNSKRRTSRAADDNKPSSSPSAESILEVLHQSRTHRKGKSVGKNFLDAQKESLKKEESAQHFSETVLTSTRPPSHFARRSPIPTLSNPREELPSENETPSPSIPRDEVGVKNEMLASTDDAVKLAEMKLPQLKEVAKSIGIKGYSKLKKSELVELLIKAQNDASP